MDRGVRNRCGIRVIGDVYERTRTFPVLHLHLSPGSKANKPYTVSQASQTAVPFFADRIQVRGGLTKWRTLVELLVILRTVNNGGHGGYTPPALVSDADLLQARAALQHQQSPEISVPREFISHIVEELIYCREQHSSIGEIEHECSHLRKELRKHTHINEAFQKELREIGEIITQVAHGDLSQRAQVHPLEISPDIAAFKQTINTMMDQLQVFRQEVSKVTREVGTEGVLGGQAKIEGIQGIWHELTVNVNAMANNLTTPSPPHALRRCDQIF